MVIIYYLDDVVLNLSGFKVVSEDDFPKYVYQHLRQVLLNRVGDLVGEVRLLYNEKKHLFALVHDGVCIIDGYEEEDEFIDEFMEELLAD